MIDTNYSLRIAYTNALAGVGASTYYLNLPNNTFPNEYIIIQGITNTDDGTFNSCDTITNITLAIHTVSDVVNSGLSADILVRDVLNRIYPNGNSVLTIDGAQMVSTELAFDLEQNMIVSGKNYKIRSLTFRHKIFQRSDIS